MQAARAKAIWYGHSVLTRVDKVPLFGRGDAREPDASRWATLRRATLKRQEGNLVRIAILALGFLALAHNVPGRAADSPDVPICAATPTGKGKPRPTAKSQTLMMVALRLEEQGEANFHLDYAAPKAPCTIGQFTTGDATVNVLHNPFEKGMSTLLYRFSVVRPTGTTDVLILYDGFVSFIDNKGSVFHVSEERDGIISWYALYNEEPSYATARAIASEIASGQAKPLMSVRWPKGAKEGEVLAFDTKRLK